jgi:hypothetical protein
MLILIFQPGLGLGLRFADKLLDSITNDSNVRQASLRKGNAHKW